MDNKYDKWDKITKESTKQIEEEEAEAKKIADEQLGLTRAPLSESQAKDEAVRETARKAKIAVQKQQEIVESGQYVFDGESKEERLLDESNINGKRIIVIKNATDCTYTLDASLKNIIKITMDGCANTKLEVSCKTITSHLEIAHCEDCHLSLNNNLVHTLQVDLCSNVSIDYNSGTFLAGDGTIEADESRIVHSGVKDMKINITENGQKFESVVDYIRDGAVAENGLLAEEIQFLTRIRDSALKTEKVIRLGQILTTSSELANHGVQVDDEESATKKLLQKDCEIHKRDGNESFQAREYTQAVVHYTQAIEKSTGMMETVIEKNEAGEEVTTTVPISLRYICYANRAACFLKLGDHERALEDANESLALSPKYTKALFRKGLALHAMKKYQEAMPVLVQCIKIEPKNSQIKQALQFCEMHLRKQQQQ